MRFKKSYFEENKPITTKYNQLDELVDSDGTPIEGDYQPSHNQIQTGPVPKSADDNSDYEKGMSTTSDKMAMYAQPRSWWRLYSGYGGTPYSRGSAMYESEIKDMLEALVMKSNSNDVVKKDIDSDIKEKLTKIEDLVSKSDLSDADKDKILNIIKDSKE